MIPFGERGLVPELTFQREFIRLLHRPFSIPVSKAAILIVLFRRNPNPNVDVAASFQLFDRDRVRPAPRRVTPQLPFLTQRGPPFRSLAAIPENGQRVGCASAIATSEQLVEVIHVIDECEGVSPCGSRDREITPSDAGAALATSVRQRARPNPRFECAVG